MAVGLDTSYRDKCITYRTSSEYTLGRDRSSTFRQPRKQTAFPSFLASLFRFVSSRLVSFRFVSFRPVRNFFLFPSLKLSVSRAFSRRIALRPWLLALARTAYSSPARVDSHTRVTGKSTDLPCLDSLEEQSAQRLARTEGRVAADSVPATHRTHPQISASIII